MAIRFDYMLTAAVLLLASVVLFNCSGKGGGGGRDHLRKEYQRDPDAYRKRWGV